MKCYYAPELALPSLRLHPYGTNADGQNGYVDFRMYPERIRNSLEDFLPYAEQSCVQTFYDLLETLNGSASHLETCDCGLGKPGPHNDPNSGWPTRITGRLFLLFRDLRLNCSTEHTDWLAHRLMTVLNATDGDMPATDGVVGVSFNHALHVSLSQGFWNENGEFDTAENDPATGRHLTLTFWAYGQTEDQAFANLDRIFRNLRAACTTVSDEIDISLKNQASTG